MRCDALRYVELWRGVRPDTAAVYTWLRSQLDQSS